MTEAPALTAEDLGTVHLVGVGGVGMSGLARLLLTRGIPTSGSELREWPQLAALKALGGTIFRTHLASNLDGVDTVVYSTAIPQDHIELATARERGLRLMHRSEALAATMVGRRAVAVAGTHGKTTTTSMITLMLQHAGLDPSFVIGGEISEVGSNAHHGSGELFVAEADESDRSFLLYNPHVAVVTNIDADHLNTYGDLQGLEDAFVEFCARTEPGGFVVTCADDPGAQLMTVRVRAAGGDVVTYGTAPDADLRLSEVRSSAQGVRYVAHHNGVPLGEVYLPVPGAHLGLNSAGALLTALRLGISAESAIEALSTFPGVRRRFEFKGAEAGVRIYDEYAYHPVPIAAAMHTLREVAAGGRLIVVFQPYRMYRTRDFQTEIAAALSLGDEAIVMEVFGPGEVREPGEGGVALTAAVDLPEDRKVFVPSWEDVPREVVARVREGDVVVTMGAPPISLMGDELLAALKDAGAGYVGRHNRPEGD
ncbi:UDP-N-acetylmuramate--L-alanine ligase [Dactylosporangium sp. NBC_01737]|uniref:UDP-N-acetylmuramate--L-alanine ligase n=1 Tax=Dactylosporangium sp. NBC_01737 TaxID=2975959 RepID=UPI002E11AE4B|nr:UDP-N-acetylmuramate--L-alanine ligase [Dactylosporangium sp. NBC_01737]